MANYSFIASTSTVLKAGGRQVAIREGVQVIGLLGVLLEGKARGYISVRGLTAELETTAGFRIADAVKQIIFREAGET